MRAKTARWIACVVCLPLVTNVASQAQETAPGPVKSVEVPSKRSKPAKVPAKRKPEMDDRDLVVFKNSPFPYEGKIPGQDDEPFLEQDPDGRQFHMAPRGGKLYADQTYNRRDSLLIIPPAFDPKAGGMIVLFFHGNLATLHDVRGRQKVPEQLRASGLNAVLVAPQLAVNALDSSPGRFYENGFLEIYLHEAADHLVQRSNGRFTAADIDALPVVIVAYSGGYLATAFSLHYALSENKSRITGVLLLDALFGEEPKFAEWIAGTKGRTFFVSAYSDASAGLNTRLAQMLGQEGIDVGRSIPTKIVPGDIVLKAAPGAVHNDFVTQAWVKNPLQDLLKRLALSGATAAPSSATK